MNIDPTICIFRVYHPSSGRVLTMFTDQPGLHFYTGNGLDVVSGKGGVCYPKYGAFCFEAQNYPDAINKVCLEIRNFFVYVNCQSIIVIIFDSKIGTPMLIPGEWEILIGE